MLQISVLSQAGRLEFLQLSSKLDQTRIDSKQRQGLDQVNLDHLDWIMESVVSVETGCRVVRGVSFPYSLLCPPRLLADDFGGRDG